MADENELGRTRRAARRQKETESSETVATGTNVWVPDEEKLFVMGVAKEQNKQTGEVQVELVEEKITKGFKVADIHYMNPPNLRKVDDMARLSHLNEPSVLYNLKERYTEDNIYTYSGLFLVAVNPYKKLPIYNPEFVEQYKGKRREDCAPHVFNIADTAYRQMLQNKQNQSMLVTGESGAGKTENTKKVIQYLTAVAGNEHGSGKLEQQLIRTNPLLEAFGNAKTLRNNNSSRFGKFIEIDFNASGYIAGCRIQNYLLESTRVVHQNPGERNFHFFYQIVSHPDSKKKYKLGDFDKFEYLNQSGCTVVPGIDDKKEFTETMTAMDIIGIHAEEREEICSIVAGLLHIGNVQFGKDGKDKATIADKYSLNLAAEYMGVDVAQLEEAILRPTITAGADKIKTQADLEQALANRNALVKSTYNRLFDWLVKRINESLAPKESIKNFIGVLDIAGFEIFDVNSFEQLCINYTNEKLQQFFNHHMFKKEQEEYMREQIEWKFMDFGLDLQPTIDLIEKQLGVLAILDQQTFLPGTDEKSLSREIIKNHKDKVQIFHTSRFDETAFSIVHYAGEVQYTTKQWLQKNVDPLNDDSKIAMSLSSKKIVKDIFFLTADEKNTSSTGAKRGAGARFMTVADSYKKQLRSLLSVLESTEPHFIRCIVPNSLQSPGIIDGKLVLHQLKCNGVLEGIRISRKGYPGRIIFKEFEKRYSLLAKKADLANAQVAKDRCKVILETAGLVEGKHFKLGLTKVFLKAGVEAMIEELRDRRIAQIVLVAQAAVRGRLSRQKYQAVKEKIFSVSIIQRNWRTFYTLRNWGWWQLFQRARPLISTWKEDQRKKEQEEEMNALKRRKAEEEKDRASLQQEKKSLEMEIAKLEFDINAEKGNVEKLQRDISSLNTSIKEYEDILGSTGKEKRDSDEERNKLINTISDKDARLKAKEDDLFSVNEKLKALSRDMENMKKSMGEKETKVAELDGSIKKMDDELASWKNKYEKEQNKAMELERIRATLEENIRDVTYNVEVAAKQKLESETRYKALHEESTQRKGEANDIQDQIAKLTDELNNLKIQLVTKGDELKSRTKTLDDLDLEKKRVINDINNVNERYNEEQRRKNKIDNDLKHAKGDKGELDNTYNRLLSEKATLEDGLNKARDEYNQLKAKIAELTEVNMQLDTKKTNLEKELRDLDLKTSEEREVNKQAIQRLQQRLEEQTQELSNQLAELQTQKSNAERNAKTAEKAVREIQRNIEEVTKVKEEYDGRVKALEAQLSELNNQLALEKKRVNDLEESKRALDNEFRNAQTKIESLKDDQGRANGRLQKAAQDLAEALEKLDILEKDRSHLTGKSSEGDRALKEQRSELATLRTQIAQLQSERDQLNNEIRAISSKVATFEDQETSLNQFNKNKADEINSLINELDAEKSSKKKLDGKTEKSDVSLKTALQRTDEEEAKLKQLETQNAETERKLRELDINISSNKTVGDDMSSKVTSAEKQLQQLQDNITDASAQLTRLRGEKRELEHTRGETELKVADLETTLKNSSQSLNELQNQLREAQQKLDDQKQFRITQEQENVRLKSEADRKRDDLATEMIKNKSQLDKLRQQMDANTLENERQLKKLVDERNELKKQLKQRAAAAQKEDSGVDQEALDKIRREYEVHIAKLSAQVSEQSNQRSELEYKKKEIDSVLNELRDRIDNEERARKKAESQNKALQIELDEIKEIADDTDALRDDIERIRSETQHLVNTVKSDIEKERKKRTEADDTLAQYKKESEQLKLELETEKKKEGESVEKLKTKFQAELADMESLLNKLKRDKANASKIVKKLERENRELSRKVTTGGAFKLDSDSKISQQDREIQKTKVDLDFQSKNSIKFEGENQRLTRELSDFKERSNKLEDELQALRDALNKERKKGAQIQRTLDISMRSTVDDDDDEY